MDAHTFLASEQHRVFMFSDASSLDIRMACCFDFCAACAIQFYRLQCTFTVVRVDSMETNFCVRVYEQRNKMLCYTLRDTKRQEINQSGQESCLRV